MGQEFAYEMWVPEERLYALFQLVNTHSDIVGNTILHWPDGRSIRVSDEVLPYQGQRPREVMLDDYEGHFSPSLLIVPNGDLKAKDYRLHHNGKYRLGRVDVGIYLLPETIQWLDSEGYYVRVKFEVADYVLSADEIDDFRLSPSIQQLFIGLAHEVEAISCVLQCEGFLERIFFLDGKEIGEEESSQIGGFHFRHYRQQLYPQELRSENENRLFACWLDQSLSYKERQDLSCYGRQDLSFHEKLERISWAYNDTDAGIRAAACKSLITTIGIDAAEKALCEIALNDSDWRVRYVAISSLLNYRASRLSVEMLFKALDDMDYRVQCAAVNVLDFYTFNEQFRARNKNFTSELSIKLEKKVEELPCRGPSMTTFFSAMYALTRVGNSRQIQLIQKRMNEPDFPFIGEKSQDIKESCLHKMSQIQW